MIVLFAALGILCSLINLASSGSNTFTGCSCDSPNVRTVLFKSTDLNKICWSQDDVALLYARRLMQEILPRRVPNNMNVLVDYIKLCLKTLQEEVASKNAHNFLLLAMTDTIGGYLQAYGFPIAKAKFYEGVLAYCVTKQINELLETTKQVLGTDGGSWTRSIYVKKSVNIAPYVVPNPTRENACSSLITSYDMINCPSDRCGKTALHIALPFLDSALHPCAIAVPFRNRSLYSLKTKDSCGILLRYYTAAMHCLYRPTEDSPTCNAPIKENPEMQQFNVDFHNWLCEVVLPHLHDEDWYPGFGSVYRLFETMSKKGIKTVSECPGSCFSINISEKNECKQTSFWFYLLCVLIFLLLFWLCVCCISACARVCGKRYSSTICSSSTSSSSGQVVNALLTLYEGSQKKNCTPGFKSEVDTRRRPKSYSSLDYSKYRRTYHFNKSRK